MATMIVPAISFQVGREWLTDLDCPLMRSGDSLRVAQIDAVERRANRAAMQGKPPKAQKAGALGVSRVMASGV